jgi:Tol biopolymer transport system component
MPARRPILLAVVVALIASLLTLAVAPAEAARPTLAAGPAVSGHVMVFTGRGPRRAKVVLQRSVRGHWVDDRTARMGRKGRFTVRALATLGVQRYRVVVAGRASRSVTVDPTPAVTRQGSAYVIRGQLSPSPRRVVRLQRRVGASWVTVSTGRAAPTFRFVWTPPQTTVVRVVAPRVVTVTGLAGKRKRVVHPAVIGRAVRLTVVPTDPLGPTDKLTYTDLTPGEERPSAHPSSSADGRVVVFVSSAWFSDDDPNTMDDVYVRDRVTGATELVSRSAVTGKAVGASDAAISADGRYVAFVTPAPLFEGQPSQVGTQVYLYDRTTGTSRQVSLGWSGKADANGASWDPSVSAHGEYVAFTSGASNLTTATDTNGASDVFRRDMSGDTTLVSSKQSQGDVAADGASFGPSISADGTRVAYASIAQDLEGLGDPGIIGVYLWGKNPQHSVLISLYDDKVVADANSGSPSISADGTAVAFGSYATNLGLANPFGVEQLYLWRETGEKVTVPVSVAEGGPASVGGSEDSVEPVISGNGRRIAFTTTDPFLAPGMAPGQKTVMVWSAAAGARPLTRLDGPAADDDLDQPALNHDGHRLVFVSSAADLAPGQVPGGHVAHVVAATIP